MNARRACPQDWVAIQTLYREARHLLPVLWWWEEHLDGDLFLVVEYQGVISGALLAWPDDSPVAWVRLAAVNGLVSVERWLTLTLPAILDDLRRRDVQALVWADYGGWAAPHLEARGFCPLTDIITMAKFDRALPRLEEAAVHIRPAAEADVPAVWAVDHEAFAPHWWHSQNTLRRRIAASPYFAVAEEGGEVIGYVEGERRRSAAHLNRIAVRPDRQGSGVGAALLRDALETFWKWDVGEVTLNTQTENQRAQRLYRRFGFETTGEWVSVWELKL